MLSQNNNNNHQIFKLTLFLDLYYINVCIIINLNDANSNDANDDYLMLNKTKKC